MPLRRLPLSRAWSGRWRPRALFALVPLALLLSGCMGEEMNWTLPASDNAEAIDDLYDLVFWLAAVVFVGVTVLTLWFSWQYRERPGREARQIHGNTRLEILWTLIPVGIVAVIAIPTFGTIAEFRGEAPEGALEVEAIGHQWWFEFQYPEDEVTTAGILYLPANTPVNVTIRSVDVIHSFWVPRLAGKVDMMPGHVNRLWFEPTEMGEYWGQCAEFCGASHANMRFRVHVVSPEEFEEFLAEQREPAEVPEEGLAAEGAQVFQRAGCGGCHSIAGVQGAVGQIGPNLTHVASREWIAGAMIENTPENMAAWLADPPELKPGSLMPDLNLTESQIEALVAFLETLE